MLSPLGVFPQAFEVVKLPLLGVHDVEHDVDVIYQCPLRTVFAAVGTLAEVVFEARLNIVGNGADLRGGAGFAKNKEIGDGFVNLAQVEAHDALAFFLLHGSQQGFENLAGAGEALGCLFAGLQAGYEVLQKRRWDCGRPRANFEACKNTSLSQQNRPGTRAEIVFLDTVDSSNNYAMAAVDDGRAGHGFTVVARRQSAGRGQRGRAWFSGDKAESLLMSTVLRPTVGVESQWTFSAAVSVAVRRAISEMYPGLDLRIKWPNDLIAADKKAGGILIENSIRGGEWAWAVAGIGVNVCQQSLPAELANATSLRMATGREVRVEDLARCVADALVVLTPEDALQEYNQWLYRRGLMQDFGLGAGEFKARILGVSAVGELMLEEADGRRHNYRHGELEWVWPQSLTQSPAAS